MKCEVRIIRHKNGKNICDFITTVYFETIDQIHRYGEFYNNTYNLFIFDKKDRLLTYRVNGVWKTRTTSKSLI